ncbi:DUF2599 domain-containing protein [Desmospora profundinema]|uniref:DUF2599 domain-containing protein n=1 Tax=Desmospora profundinema TaxID=1571184 RepID=UPI0035B55366
MGSSTYFKSVKWIKRGKVVSLSIRPKAILFDAPNGNVALYHAAKSFEILKKNYSKDKRWKNTKSMRVQYDCHVLSRGIKQPWNLEPHRTETRLPVVIAKGCNP